MIRTIEEMEMSDTLQSYCNVSDVLAFCIVASDYLRAKRRRFPLGIRAWGELMDNLNDSCSWYLHLDENTLDLQDVVINVGEQICFSYLRLSGNNDTEIDHLWDYTKEYVDD